MMSNMQDPNGTTQKPPFLDKEDFSMWKQRMIHFFVLYNDELWTTIMKGPFIPTKFIGTEENLTEVPKTPDEYSDAEAKNAILDQKAQAVIAMACPKEVIRSCGKVKSAKELWERLSEMFEGTPDVKANRVQLLVQQYEAFTNMPGESLDKLYERFNCLVNELRASEKEYSNVDLLNKFIRALPDEWHLIKTVIRKSPDFNSYTLSRLYGELRTHSLEMEQDKRMKSGTIKDVG